MHTLLFHGICIPTAGVVEQRLQGATVLKRATDGRRELVRDVDPDASPVDPAVEHVARVLVAPRTGGAVIAHAGAPPKLSDPNAAGHSPAACVRNQRSTSAGDSLVVALMVTLSMIHYAHIHLKL